MRQGLPPRTRCCPLELRYHQPGRQQAQHGSAAAAGAQSQPQQRTACAALYRSQSKRTARGRVHGLGSARGREAVFNWTFWVSKMHGQGQSKSNCGMAVRNASSCPSERKLGFGIFASAAGHGSSSTRTANSASRTYAGQSLPTRPSRRCTTAYAGLNPTNGLRTVHGSASAKARRPSCSSARGATGCPTDPQPGILPWPETSSRRRRAPDPSSSSSSDRLNARSGRACPGVLRPCSDRSSSSACNPVTSGRGLAGRG